MPIYEFRCPSCAEFRLRLPIAAETSAPVRCPVCSEHSPRVFRAPGVARTPGGLAVVRSLEEASRDQPQVVRRAAAGDAGGKRPVVRARPHLPALPRP
ncbi:putative regulatory protein, FmdB family [Frankineae bacterium MT45]|nr:putative regulatory protein, FmdB family [Frankineae bacterium MT45]